MGLDTRSVVWEISRSKDVHTYCRQVDLGVNARLRDQRTSVDCPADEPQFRCEPPQCQTVFSPRCGAGRYASLDDFE